MIQVKNIFKGKILDIINDEVMSPRNENVKTITTLKEALEKIKQLKSTYFFKRESEHVSIPDSVGRELSEDIVANYMSPEFDISGMDGFAFRCEDNYPLKISGSVYAGDSIVKMNNGEAMAIATGAILPEGADTVLKIEDVMLPEEGFEYILFVKIINNTASSMGRQMKLFDREYNTAIISASPRSAVVEGYVITNRDIGKDELVNVCLFN